MKVIWKNIIGFPNYSVSNFGYIKSHGNFIDGRKRNTHIMRPNKAGSVVLRKNRKNHSRKIGQLILRAFVGRPPRGKQLARHLDDNITNNILSNLAWGNHQDNYNDGVRNGRNGHNTPGARLRGNALRGKPRPDWVKRKISATKHKFPEQQYYGETRNPTTGRWI